MNRIKEIAEEADLEYNFDPMLWLKYEKFAELIIQECLDIIKPYAIHMNNFDGGHPLEDIKKHFNIK